MLQQLVQVAITCVIKVAVLALRTADNQNRHNARSAGKYRRQHMLFIIQLFYHKKEREIPRKGIKKDCPAILKPF